MKGQHVPYLDRRCALARDVMHRIVPQLEVEKIKMPIGRLLNEAMFCTNALLRAHTVHGMCQFASPNEGDLPHLGTIRHAHRLRKIAVAAMCTEFGLPLFWCNRSELNVL